MSRYPSRHQSVVQGFTLIELLVMVVVAVTLIGTAFPSLVSMMQSHRMQSVSDDLISDFSLARSTAITSGSWSTVCASNFSGKQCNKLASDWNNGWIVFRDRDNDGEIDAGESVISVMPAMQGQLQLLASAPRFSFEPQGSARGFAGDLIICDAQGSVNYQGVIISASGRAREAESAENTVSCP